MGDRITYVGLDVHKEGIVVAVAEGAFRLRIGDTVPPQKAPIPEVSEPPSAPATISELSADNEVALELALWDSVKDGSPAELESYLEQYPDGTFALLARTRLDATALSPADPATPTLEEAAAEALDLAFGIP